ncbi:hypothetical protein K0038_04518 [Pseudomonas syringae]|nr:hypothetical protein [Pseudomonas syringae]
MTSWGAALAGMLVVWLVASMRSSAERISKCDQMLIRPHIPGLPIRCHIT